MKVIFTEKDLTPRGKSLSYEQLEISHFNSIVGVSSMQICEAVDQVIFITPDKKVLVLKDKCGLQNIILELGSAPEEDETFIDILTKS